MPFRFSATSCVILACAPLSAQALNTASPAAPYGLSNQSFQAILAYAPGTGEIWGYTTNTRFAAVLLEYGVSLTHGAHVRLRYTPSIVPFASLEERAPSQTNPAAPTRSYAAGARPVGLEVDFARGRRLQPFGATSGGFLYYNQRVLSPGGSQFMFTLDFGGGVRFFQTPRNAWSLGYRYQHESNANISLHNPGTDSHTITLGFSRYRSR